MNDKKRKFWTRLIASILAVLMVAGAAYYMIAILVAS